MSETTGADVNDVEKSLERIPEDRWISFTVTEKLSFVKPVTERIPVASFDSVCRKCLLKSGQERIRLSENGRNSVGLTHVTDYGDTCVCDICLIVEFLDRRVIRKFIEHTFHDAIAADDPHIRPAMDFMVSLEELEEIINGIPASELGLVVIREQCPYFVEHSILSINETSEDPS